MIPSANPPVDEAAEDLDGEDFFRVLEDRGRPVKARIEGDLGVEEFLTRNQV